MSFTLTYVDSFILTENKRIILGLCFGLKGYDETGQQWKSIISWLVSVFTIYQRKDTAVTENYFNIIQDVKSQFKLPVGMLSKKKLIMNFQI